MAGTSSARRTNKHGKTALQLLGEQSTRRSAPLVLHPQYTPGGAVGEGGGGVVSQLAFTGLQTPAGRGLISTSCVTRP